MTAAIREPETWRGGMSKYEKPANVVEFAAAAVVAREQAAVTSQTNREATGDTASQPRSGAYAIERRIACLESENESLRGENTVLLDRIAELEQANRRLSYGVSPGYWRAGARLANLDAQNASTAPILSEQPSPFELGPERRKGKPV